MNKLKMVKCILKSKLPTNSQKMMRIKNKKKILYLKKSKNLRIFMNNKQNSYKKLLKRVTNKSKNNKLMIQKLKNSKINKFKRYVKKSLIKLYKLRMVSIKMKKIYLSNKRQSQLLYSYMTNVTKKLTILLNL